MQLSMTHPAPGFTFSQKQHQEFLEPGDTTIMLRSIPRAMSTHKFKEELDKIVGQGDYDMIHLNRVKTGQNIGFAVINCTSPMAAQKCIEAFRLWCLWDEIKGKMVTCRPLQAHIQGLGPNLAYFLASAGFDDLQNSSAPRVFMQGSEVELQLAIAHTVTESMLSCAYQLKDALKKPAPNSGVHKTAGHSKSKSRPDTKVAVDGSMKPEEQHEMGLPTVLSDPMRITTLHSFSSTYPAKLNSTEDWSFVYADLSQAQVASCVPAAPAQVAYGGSPMLGPFHDAGAPIMQMGATCSFYMSI
eukprot:TRINITY_DN17916_c0_g1_i2.p1 TRINITY_DN17916_c0_g1~~TRINITY_DN17916_c0_g1_i2.p1  ORF type:complete len:300 (-),score=58.47 TRINITY_DN17916_c0_g1_i2:169-1068(-)